MTKVFAGIDLSKGKLDIHLGGKGGIPPNDLDGFQIIVGRMGDEAGPTSRFRRGESHEIGRPEHGVAGMRPYIPIEES